MNKHKTFLSIIFIIVSYSLFLTSHYLLSIYYLAGKVDVGVNWNGLRLPILIIDVCMYLATILLFSVIGIIIYEIE